MTQSRVRVRLLACALAACACVLAAVLPAAAKDEGDRGDRHAAEGPRGNGHGHGRAPDDSGWGNGNGQGNDGQGGASFRADGDRGRDNRGRRGGHKGGDRPAGAQGLGDQPGGRGRSHAHSQGNGKAKGNGNGNRARAQGNGNSGPAQSKGGDRDRSRGERRGASTGGGQAGARSPSPGGSTGVAPTPSGGSTGTASTPQPATPAPPAPSGASGGGDDAGERGGSRRRSTGRGRRSGSGEAAPRRRTTTSPGGFVPAPRIVDRPLITRTATGDAAVAPIGRVSLAGDRKTAVRQAAGRATGFRADDSGNLRPVTQTVERIVEVVPGALKLALLALALVALVFAIHSFFAGRRARNLARQREELLDEVGLLQAALLPAVPGRLGELGSTVAYRPADGPAAGGDFYDAFAFDGGRVGVIVGDVSGHGRDALARTALMRYTLRAYLDAGLEPRAALKVAGSVLDEDLGDDFATVVIAVYDPDAGTLTYASAGHPPPILLGPAAHDPVTSYSSPPIGVGATTGLRQTTVGIQPGSVACFYTDGLVEARIDGELLGRERLTEMLASLGPEATAAELLERVAEAADRTPDDMAACILTPQGGAAARVRVEELEVALSEIGGDAVPRFLRDCGIPMSELPAVFREAAEVARTSGTAVLRVRLGEWRPGIDVLPGNVETLAGAARRRVSAATAP